MGISARRWSRGLAVVVTAIAATTAHAELHLTADGLDLGFTLSQFALTRPGYNGCCSGPFGVAYDPRSGNVLVNQAGTRYVFKNTDNQTLADAIGMVPSSSGTYSFATAGNGVYGGNGSQFVMFATDGSVDHVLTGVTARPYLGMWGNLANGHIIATSSEGLIDIDPLAAGGLGSYRLITRAFGDGVSVSADGKTAYLADGKVLAYDIATGNLVDSFAAGAGFGVDGTGVISSTDLGINGRIVANMNSGDVNLIDPVTGTSILIATGGTRGDYAAPDLSNGTLFLDGADAIWRLSCGEGCSIGGPPPSAVPEPATAALAGVGLAIVGIARRRQRQRGA